MLLSSGPHMFLMVFRGEALVVGSVPWPPRARPCGIRVCRSLVLRRWSGALAALMLISSCRRSLACCRPSRIATQVSVLCSCSSWGGVLSRVVVVGEVVRPSWHWPCAGSGFAGHMPCAGGEALVCASADFALPLLISPCRRSLVCCRSSRTAMRVNVLCLCSFWCGAPSRRGVVGEENSPFRLVDVAGVSQGFRGRHWSAARSTGGTELGGYTGGQYSLRKVVHPEGSSGPDKLRHLVPGRGVEPLRPHGQRILSAPRLPFRHPGQLAHCGTKLASEHIMLMWCSHAVSREGGLPPWCHFGLRCGPRRRENVG